MKRNLTEVFDGLSNEAAYQLTEQYAIKEYVDDMSKQRVYQNVMQKIDGSQSARRSVRRRPGKTAVAAAAVVAALTLASGSAVAAAKLFKGFTDYKPAYTEQQKETVKKATFAIDKTISSDGVTVTAVEGLCDGQKLFILANIEIDPSQVTVPDGYDFFSRLRLHMSGDFEDTQMYPSLYNQVLERNGNTCTVLYTYDMTDIQDGQTLAISAWDLAATSKDGTDSTDPIADKRLGGLTFEAHKSDFAKTFSVDSGIKVLDADASVSAGYISPWYAQFYVSSAAIAGNYRDEAYSAAVEARLHDESSQPVLKVVMKDGAVYEGVGVSAAPGVSEVEPAESYSVTFDYYCSFKEYVDTADIDHVEINGIKVNVK